MTIRPATAADIAAVQAIAAANATAPQWSNDQFRDLLRTHPGSAIQRTLLVASHGATITGFAVISALGTVYPVEAELESIAVLPAFHGKGIGLRLMNAVFSWCKQNSVDAIRLEVRVSNRTAIALYRRVGFESQGIRPGYYAAPREDAMCMVCNQVSVNLLHPTQ